MRRGLIAGCVAIAAAALGALSASAQQTPDPPICNTNLREWGGLAGGTDAQAMRGLLTRTPNACRELREQISSRIAALTPPPIARVPLREEAPVDPCIAAREQWRRIETTGSLDQVRAYLNGAPSTCTPERRAAQTRLAALEEAARPRLPQDLVTRMTPYVSAAALNWLTQQSVAPPPGFRRHVVETHETSESGFSGRTARGDQRCTPSWLPSEYGNGVSITEKRTTTRRDYWFLSEVTGSSSVRYCSPTGPNPSQQPLDSSWIVLGPNSLQFGRGYNGEYGIREASGSVNVAAAPLSMDVSATRGLAPSGNPVYRTICSEARRTAPGAWRREFDFTIVELACRVETGGRTYPSTEYFVPELATVVYFVGSRNVDGSPVPSNAEVVREQNAVRVSYRTTRDGGISREIRQTEMTFRFTN